MSDPLQNQTSQNIPTSGTAGDSMDSFPESAPTASPSDFFPPPPPPTVRKFASGKIVATFLSMLLLIAGLGAGLVLVQNPQLLKQQAAVVKTTPMPNCEAELECSISVVDGATSCLSNEGQLNYCCDKDYMIAESMCVHK